MRKNMDTRLEAVKKRFDLLSPHLSEQSRRLFVAAEAQALGVGGASIVSELTGISRAVIATGMKELEGPSTKKNAKKRWGP
jgi:hypothetical protein